jgi:outer membrane biosynthesis protein TonB
MILLLRLAFPANFSSVRHRLLPLLFLSVQLFLVNFGALSADGQSNQKACRKPPEIANQPKTPEEYREKWKKVKVHGRIAIAIDEDGRVSHEKLLEASPKEAADALLATAKTISFKPRPGCGTFKTEMIFTLNE